MLSGGDEISMEVARYRHRKALVESREKYLFCPGSGSWPGCLLQARAPLFLYVPISIENIYSAQLRMPVLPQYNYLFHRQLCLALPEANGCLHPSVSDFIPIGCTFKSANYQNSPSFLFYLAKERLRFTSSAALAIA